jgi:dihydroflavonol-4-reductase
MHDTVFVTGGTGFLGRHLIPTLSHAGYLVRVLTRRGSTLEWLSRCLNVTPIQGDVQDKNTIQAAVAGCRYVIHAAGYFRFWGDETAFDRTNVGGTQNVLDAALAAKVERVIHISTIAVIGDPDPSRMVDETHPPRPADPYQRSKLKAETLALRCWQESELPVVVLRPGAFYGPLGTYAFNRLFFRDPLRGIIMQINGGTYITFPTYVPDVAQAILTTFKRGRLGEVYNICDEPITHKAAFDIVCGDAKLWYPRLNLPGWMGISAAHIMEAASTITRREPFYPLNLRSYVYNYWRVSNEKARRELNFTPTPFVEGARRTIAWYREGQPDMIPEVEC